MIDITNRSVDELANALARRIAQDAFECHQDMYHEEKEYLASEGETESSFMKSSVEHVETYFENTDMLDEIIETAVLKYRSLCNKRYRK